VGHPGGPLLVLAGPGTGKTATLVEAVVERVRRGLDPERLLVLTFSRRAAAELRARVTARLGRVTREPLALTFHSYAFALLRREAALAGEPPPRLLSGPEHDLEIRRLLRGEVADGSPDWPERLRPVLLTRGFAAELRDLLLRAQERGLDGESLAGLGASRGRDDWVAAGRFLRRYAGRFAVDPAGPALDYAALIGQAADLLEDPSTRERERAARLVHGLAGGGRDLLAVGDPDQSIYGFRGADVRCIREFPDRFRTRTGEAAPVLALTECRRFGGELLTASRRVAERLPAISRGGDHRALVAADTVRPADVRVVLAESNNQEAALVADVLRRAHLLDGIPWSQMAVLVRSAVRQVPVLRRALAAAGVPAEVSGDEVPLVAESAVRPLLLLLRAALDPDGLDSAVACELITGPLGGGDALQLRRLRQALRELEFVTGARTSSGELLVEVLRDPRDLSTVAPRVGGPARRVARLLAAAGEVARAGGSVEDVLWRVWSASGLGSRWQTESVAGGYGGLVADRNLDAVLALFDAAARFTDRLPHAGARLFLDDVAGQAIPADTLADRAPAGDGVRVLTAHRSKGLEWDLVVVAGVQDGRWPDVRMRASLLGAEELVDVASGRDPSPPATAAALLQEERRLFYVAVTRARWSLVVTAVGGSDDDEERPSRFLAELLPSYQADRARLPRALALPALVAELRSALVDPHRPAALRRAAAARLAQLAEEGVPGAHPGQWYVLVRPTDDQPYLTPGECAAVSPSQVQRFGQCALRWLLERGVGVAGAASPAQTVGNLVHALAVLAAQPGIGEETQLVARLDEVWAELDLGGRWFSRKQREFAIACLHRLLSWHRSNPRPLLAVEEAFTLERGGVRVTGRVDRLERDEHGRGVVVDLKTGATQAPADELARHPQLGVYQLAVALGAFARLGVVEPGGAELVQVGKAATRHARVQRQGALTEDDDPGWVEDLLRQVAEGMASSVFTATVNELCRVCPVRTCCPAHPDGAMVVP
jgi:superfamily I DNA/RNA helicase/RecB family exonuclease